MDRVRPGHHGHSGKRGSAQGGEHTGKAGHGFLKGFIGHHHTIGKGNDDSLVSGTDGDEILADSSGKSGHGFLTGLKNRRLQTGGMNLDGGRVQEITEEDPPPFVRDPGAYGGHDDWESGSDQSPLLSGQTSPLLESSPLLGDLGKMQLKSSLDSYVQGLRTSGLDFFFFLPFVVQARILFYVGPEVRSRLALSCRLLKCAVFHPLFFSASVRGLDSVLDYAGLQLHWNSSISDDSLRIIGLRMTDLRALVMAGNGSMLTDGGLVELSTNLGGCSKVSDKGIGELVKRVRTIQHIYLRGTQASDISMITIATLLRDLKTLSVAGCEKVSDYGVKYLLSRRKPESLDLRGCSITSEALEVIKSSECPQVFLSPLSSPPAEVATDAPDLL